MIMLIKVQKTLLLRLDNLSKYLLQVMVSRRIELLFVTYDA